MEEVVGVVVIEGMVVEVEQGKEKSYRCGGAILEASLSDEKCCFQSHNGLTTTLYY